MKTAYDYDWANYADRMSAGIDFDADCVTADELQMMQTREAILAKLRIIFGQRRQSAVQPITSEIKVTTLGQEMSERPRKIG